MEISQGTVANPKNEYLYNIKELQESTGLYDYGARFYDPVIGRFNTIDAYAEKYSPITPYQYGANNPIKNIDMNGDSTWSTTTRVSHGNNVTETRTQHITGKVINEALSTVSSSDLAASINDRLNSQTSTESYTNSDGGTTTINYKMDASYQGVTSMDQVNSNDHLVVVVNDVTGQANQALGGGDAGGMANISSKVAYIEAGAGSYQYDEYGFHEIGHDLGLPDAKVNSTNDPMSYTGQNANFSVSQFRSIYQNNTLNQGQNSMTIGNKREITNFNSTQYRPYKGVRKYGMKVPMPIAHN